MSLGPSFWPKTSIVSESDSIDLIKEFSMEEIKEVVFGMKENSAPGPNGYGVVFFKKF
jgi:hypothetical protein